MFNKSNDDDFIFYLFFVFYNVGFDIVRNLLRGRRVYGFFLGSSLFICSF